MNSFYIVSLFLLLNFASKVKCWSDDEEDELHQKYRALSSQRKMYIEQFITFLRVVEKNAVEDASEQVLSFDLTLSRQELNDITAALNSRSCPDHVISLLGKVRPRYSWSLRIFDTIADLVKANKTMSYIVAVTLSAFLLLIYWLHMSKSWLSAFSKMFALVFILSVVVTTFRKYEEQLVKKRVFLQNGVPLSCRPQDQGYMYSMWLFVKSMFSVQEDECVKYYEAELIDPLLGFTLSEAVSETFARFILTPVPIIFEYLSKSILKFFQVLPPFLWFPASVMMIIIYLIANRYRVRTILGSLEPADSLSFNQTSLPWNGWPNSPMSALPVEQNHLQRNMITAKGKNIQIIFEDDTKTKTLILKEPASVPDKKLDFLEQNHAVLGDKLLCLPTTETQNKIQINFGDNSVIISQGPEEDLSEPTVTGISMKVEHNDNTSRGSSTGTRDNNMSSSAKGQGVTSDKSHPMRNKINAFVTRFKDRCYSLYLLIHLYSRILYQKAQNWNERTQTLQRLFSFLKKAQLGAALMLHNVLQMVLSKIKFHQSGQISKTPHRLFCSLKKYIISTALKIHGVLRMVLSKIKFQRSGQISSSQLYSEPKLNMSTDEQCRYSKKSTNQTERELSFESPSTETRDFCSTDTSKDSSDAVLNQKPNFESNRSSTTYQALKEKYHKHLASALSTLFFGIHQNYAKTLIEGIDAQSASKPPWFDSLDCHHEILDKNSGTKLSTQQSSECASEQVCTQVQPRSHKDNPFLENLPEAPLEHTQLKMSSPNFRSRLIAQFYILYGKCHKLMVHATKHIENVICSVFVGLQLVGKVLQRAFYKFKMAVVYARLSVHNRFLANVSVIAHIILCSITVMIYVCVCFICERLLIYFEVRN